MDEQQLAALLSQFNSESAAPQAVVRPSRLDLGDESRAAVIPSLGDLLTTLIDLRLQARQAHWNVRGRDFYQLHQLFDEIQEALDSFSDRVAERVAGLGGFATSCVRCVSKHSPLSPLDETHEPLGLVSHLANGIALLSSQCRYVASICDCDIVTENIVCDLSEIADKYLWQLEATIDE